VKVFKWLLADYRQLGMRAYSKQPSGLLKTKFRFEEKQNFIRTRDVSEVHNMCSAFVVLLSLHATELHKYQII